MPQVGKHRKVLQELVIVLNPFPKPESRVDHKLVDAELSKRVTAFL